MTKIQVLRAAQLAILLLTTIAQAIQASEGLPPPPDANLPPGVPSASKTPPSPGANRPPSPPSGAPALPTAGPNAEQIAIFEPANMRNGPRNSPGDKIWRKRWLASLAPVVAAQSLDAASSYGMPELNPLLAGPDGRFGATAVGIKFGLAGGLLGAEYLLVKKYPRAARFFTLGNYSAVGVLTGLAVHNYQLGGR